MNENVLSGEAARLSSQVVCPWSRLRNGRGEGGSEHGGGRNGRGSPGGRVWVVEMK